MLHCSTIKTLAACYSCMYVRYNCAYCPNKGLYLVKLRVCHFYFPSSTAIGRQTIKLKIQGPRKEKLKLQPGSPSSDPRMLKGWMAPSPNIRYPVQNMTPSAYRHINLPARDRITRSKWENTN